jgi:hypothetical protein
LELRCRQPAAAASRRPRLAGSTASTLDDVDRGVLADLPSSSFGADPSGWWARASEVLSRLDAGEL